MHTLNFYAYCGTMMEIAKGDEDEVRKAAARVIRRRRNQDFPVWSLNKGRRWEIGEPEDCMMIPHSCGILKIVAEPEEEIYDENYFEDIEE
jgi:hypothetical protein